MKDEMKQFLEYVASYDLQDPAIFLKRNHSLRVTGYMKRLTAEVNLDPSQREPAVLAALFHDIGRFEQWKTWHTFLDSQSVDHALLSAQILSGSAFLDALRPPEKERVITAIRLHNVLELPSGLDPDTDRLARMLRDADKLDILYVFAREDGKSAAGSRIEDLAHDTISDAVYDSLMSGRPVNKNDRKTGLDRWITPLGFFFDFSYGWSRRTAFQEGYWKEPYEHISFQNPVTARRIRDILDKVTESV